MQNADYNYIDDKLPLIENYLALLSSDYADAIMQPRQL